MKIKYLIVLGFFVLANNINAQELPTFKNPQTQITPSPTAGSLGTYGGIDLKKSTGGVAKSIPLFQQRQGAISYNPTIEYFSTGVRVNDWGGRLGIGWSDNFTATIQRTVRSVPDEYTTQRLTTSVYQLVQAPTLANYQIIANLEAHGNVVNGVGSFDGEYDLFSYNIFGVSGQFIIINNQAVLLNHKENVKIDILSTSPFHKFRVTDANGFKYYFETEIEYTSMGVDEYITTNLPTAWFLNKIESPYNDVLNFNYSSVSYACKTDFFQNFIFKDGPIPSERERYIECADNLYHAYGNSYDVSRRYTQTKCLTSVVGTNFKVVFDYVSRLDLVGDKLLSAITLYDGQNNFVSNVNFGYDTYTATTQPQGVLFVNDDLYPGNFGDLKKRYFLKTVTFPNTGSKAKEYTFTYINPQDLPHRLSFSQDEGGYYNGVSNTWFIPRARVEEYISRQDPTLWRFPYTFTGDRRPNYTASKAGILYQITYPTGGSDEIQYSPNTYIDWENEESYFPGLRVVQVTTQSLTSPPIVKTYNYYNFTKQGNVLNYSEVVSSNIIDRRNAYVKFVSTKGYFNDDCDDRLLKCWNIGYTTFSSNSRFDLNAFQGNSIAYRCVTEELGGNAFTAGMFDVSVDLPAYIDYGDESFLNPKENTAWGNGLELLRFYGTRIGNYYSILKEQAWNYENTISQSIENCCVYKKYEGTGYCGGLITYEPYTISSYNLWNNWYKLTSFTETQYNENNQNPVINTTNYYYDNATHAQLTRAETTDSKGNFIKTITKYPLDINTGVYASMASLNMHNYPIEQTAYINNQVNSSVLTTYKAGGGSYVPDKAYSLETTSPLPSFTFFNGTTKDSHYSNTPKMSYDVYTNSTANIMQYTPSNNFSTSIVWAYNQSYPVVKGDNVTYSILNDVVIAAGATNLETFWSGFNDIATNSAQQTAWRNFNTSLRSNPSLVNAQITTYTYKPLVGMTSQTDPNGLSTYYEYDGFGRLKTVLNNDDKVTGHYIYNYLSPTPPPPPDASLTISSSSQSFQYNGGSSSITVTCNTTWSVGSVPSWITVTPSSGTGNGSFTINAGQNSGTLRSATLTIIAGGISRSIAVEQAAYVQPPPPPFNFTISAIQGYPLCNVGPDYNPFMYNYAQIDLWYIFGPYQTYANQKVQIEPSISNPLPMDYVDVMYYNSIDWLDLYYDETTNQLTFYATRYPGQADWAVISLTSQGVSRNISVKISDY